MMEPQTDSIQPRAYSDDVRADGSALWPVAALLLAIGGWVAFRWFTGIQLEDALITYRYAENLAQGNGFVFNVGEHVLGTTTPLLTLLLGLGGLLFGIEHIPLIANVLGISAGALAAIAVYRVLRFANVGVRWSAITMLVLSLHPTMLWTTTGGMETPLVICFMATSLLAVLRSRWALASTLVALLALTRPDALIWAGLVLLVMIWRAGRRSVGPLIAFIVIVGAWTGFAQWYFGSPVPHSVTAKRALELKYSVERGPMKEFCAYGHWYLANLWLPHTYGIAKHQVWGWLVLLALGVLGIARRRVAGGPLFLLPVFIIGFCAAFYAGHAPTFPWYAMPLTWASVLLGMLGLWELWILFSLYWREYDLPRFALGVGVGVVVLVIAGSLANRDRVTYQYEKANQVNETGLRRVAGEWLADHAKPTDVVATEAIGYQGYYSKLPILDIAGLVSPQVVKVMKCSESNAETFHHIVRDLAPEYIVLRTFEVQKNRHFHGGPLFADALQERDFRDCYSAAWVGEAPQPDAWNWRLMIDGESCSMSRLTIYQRKTDAPAKVRKHPESPDASPGPTVKIP
ncbi:MAG: hypothetical protein H6817_01745 [Phycisphaerales bacterium]|nr:hypothetical protein [Phycisphaerales bacterium]